MVNKGLLFFFMLIIISAPFAVAEIMTTVKVTDYLIFLRLIDDEIDPTDREMFGMTNLLSSRLDIKSRGNDNVKAEFQLDCDVTGNQLIPEVPRAYVKVRFPGFRLTAGKTRVSWGEGFMFNAGDVIFGGMSLTVDFSQAVLRDETDIFTVVYIPLGRFSYIEAVFLPFPQFNPLVPNSAIPIPKDITDTNIGGRIAGEISGITLEGGYLSEGASQLHKAYIAAHGALLVDWYLASSLTIPNEEPDSLTTEEYIQDSWAISCGFFNIIGLEGDANLSLRFEAGIYPYGDWEEWEPDPEIPGVQYPSSPYGIYLFPEISYAPESNMSFQLRSLISPVDLSAVIITGMNWNIYQGFTIGFMATAMLGDEDDLFGWDRDGDLAFILSAEYIFGE